MIPIVCAVPNKQSTIASHFGAIRWPWLAKIIPDIHVGVSGPAAQASRRRRRQWYPVLPCLAA